MRRRVFESGIRRCVGQVLIGVLILALRAGSAPPPQASGRAAESDHRAGRNEDYALVVSKAGKIHAVLTYEMTVPGVNAEEWIVVAPAPPRLPSQSDIRARLFPAGKVVHERSPLRRALLSERLPGDAGADRHRVSVRAEYEATLWARRLVPRSEAGEAAAPPRLAPEERRASLGRPGVIDFDAPAFQKWLRTHDLTIGPSEGEVDYARRVFLALKKGFKYDFTGRMDRHASRVCTAGKSDCGGLSVVFVAALRSQKISARVLVGRWAFSAERGQQIGGLAYHQEHAKAEFFAEGVGWVPVDVASGILHDPDRQGLRDFGNDPGDFLTFHLDNDLVVDTRDFGLQTLQWFNGGMAIWVRGSRSAEEVEHRQDWQVERPTKPADRK